jgi:cytoskeletal protein CcmA (bactofilin family)
VSDTHISDDAFINSIIGEGTRFKGEFDLNGLLRIDGDFSGTIRTKGKVLVGQNGRAECTLHAGTVVIGGVVRGEIFSTEKVIILSTGLVLGNVTTPRLIVEEGVILNGACTITAPAGSPAAPAPEPAGGGSRPPSNGGRPQSAKADWNGPPREVAPAQGQRR